MRIYLSLLVLVSINCGITLAIQFENDAASVTNLEQTKIANEGSGFFPTSDERDDRYSEISGIKYVDDYESFDSENRKQLNFNGNLPVRSPPQQQPVQAFLSENQFYQQISPETYRPSLASINSLNAIRQRPKFPYQFASPSNNKYYQSDLTNPLYQNYANYYQYPSPSSQIPSLTSSSSLTSPYYDYFNPTRYPSSSSASASANLYGQALHQQQRPHYSNYYTNNYANQFGYQRPTSSLYGNNAPGISNIINNIRDTSSGPLNQISTVGSQFSKALEDISINDDLQCVPKILCQMIRNPRKPNQLPSFLNLPGITAIISALPSTSPLMNFGRAALLGLSGGECDSSYPKCPRDENQVLYYLNNHRGGFFRFFNGGNSFGDDDLAQQNQQQQLNQQQSSQGLNLLALQALADTLSGSTSGSGGNGINLGNLFSSQTSQRPTVQNYQGLQADQSQNVGFLSMLKPNVLSDVVSNLLTGVIGNRFSRQLNKRSVTDGDHKIQKRIVNLKENHVKFIESTENFNIHHKNTLFDEIEKPLRFSNDKRINQQQKELAQSYAMRFPLESQEVNKGNFISPADVENKLKMLFPDVDHFSEQFTQNLLRLIINDQKYGKILTGGQRPTQSNSSGNNDKNNLSYYSINRYPVSQSQKYYTGSGSSSSSSSNYNNNYDNRRPQHTNSHNNNNSDRSHIVYVTNAQGQVEYSLNELTGEKTRYL